MQNTSRRKFLIQSSAFAVSAWTFPLSAHRPTQEIERSGLGVAAASYAFRWRSGQASQKIPGFENALQMLEHCNAIGAAGVQVSAQDWSSDFTGKVRDYREKMGLYLEGSIRLPQHEGDIARFESEARNSHEAGANILRTACLYGRRYEDLMSREAFEKFRAGSIKSIYLAIPILEKYKLKLAIENHKDWRISDLLDIIRHFESEWVGVNLDTGNNISFLEDPMEVVEKLAPYTFTTHFKDMAVEECEEGFLLSEVPLGKGYLDLKRMVEIFKSYNRDVKFNLEMITRNPLKVPCLQENYWATFEEIPAMDLAMTLKKVKETKKLTPLPTIDGKSDEARLIFEEQNIIESFEYAKGTLGLI